MENDYGDVSKYGAHPRMKALRIPVSYGTNPKLHAYLSPASITRGWVESVHMAWPAKQAINLVGTVVQDCSKERKV